jgi:hypothetical protein
VLPAVSGYSMSNYACGVLSSRSGVNEQLCVRCKVSEWCISLTSIVKLEQSQHAEQFPNKFISNPEAGVKLRPDSPANHNLKFRPRASTTHCCVRMLPVEDMSLFCKPAMMPI